MRRYYGGLFAGITIGFGVSGVILHSSVFLLAGSLATIVGGVLWARFEAMKP